MREPIKWARNEMPKTKSEKKLPVMTQSDVEIIRRFHRSFPQYLQTPLVNLSRLAANFGISGIFVKDESFRFDLNSFKVLGVSYAIAKYIAKKIGKEIHELDYTALVSDETKQKSGDITFYAATDGNHGRAVAWAANKLRQKSVVLMPKGSSRIRLQNIINEGAEAGITDLNYDDTVRLATKKASEDPNGVFLQGTAWEGYEEIPAWVMQGYGTMSCEAHEQLKEAGVEKPTHIFLQAGVGSLAGSVASFFADAFPDNPPLIAVLEASAADCLYLSNKEGRLLKKEGDLSTLMAGLSCGEANILSWEILKNLAEFFVSVPDWVAARGMRVLASPLKGDTGIISGESGAATTGLLYTLLRDSEYKELREALKINADSVVLLFSSEGNTDPEKYLDVVWDGEYPSGNI